MLNLKKCILTVMILNTTGMFSQMARADDESDYADEIGAWAGDAWNGAGWYVTEPVGRWPALLKGPFNSDSDCSQNLPNVPEPNAASHSWYCAYFQVDPIPKGSTPSSN
jgi:hypothetical protein